MKSIYSIETCERRDSVKTSVLPAHSSGGSCHAKGSLNALVIVGQSLLGADLVLPSICVCHVLCVYLDRYRTLDLVFIFWQRFCEPGQTKNWTLSSLVLSSPVLSAPVLSAPVLSDTLCPSVYLCSVCLTYNIARDATIKLPTAWVLSIDIGYWCSPLPDKLSAEDRSLSYYKKNVLRGRSHLCFGLGPAMCARPFSMTTLTKGPCSLS